MAVLKSPLCSASIASLVLSPPSRFDILITEAVICSSGKEVYSSSRRGMRVSMLIIRATTGAVCIRSKKLSGMNTDPMLRLSSSSHIASPSLLPERSSYNRLAKCSEEGCGGCPRAPNADPRCDASRSRSVTCAPALAIWFSIPVLPLPVSPPRMM